MIWDQELAGLDILTNGDYHLDFDLAGRSWFSYPSERLSGISEFDTETTAGWAYPIGTWLNEIVGGWKYHAIVDKIGPRVPLEFAKIWRVAQSRTEKPVKFGTIAADLASTVLTVQTDVYDDDKRELMWDLATILNAELRQLVAAGCKVVQIEEPAIHSAAAWGADEATLDFFVDLFNYTVEGLDEPRSGCTRAGATRARSTASSRASPTRPRSRSILERINADVWTIESKHNGHSAASAVRAVQGEAEQEDRRGDDQPSRAPGRDGGRGRGGHSAARSSTSSRSTSCCRPTAGSAARACLARSRCTRRPRSPRARTSSATSSASRRRMFAAADPAAADRRRRCDSRGGGLFVGPPAEQREHLRLDARVSRPCRVVLARLLERLEAITLDDQRRQPGF